MQVFVDAFSQIEEAAFILLSVFVMKRFQIFQMFFFFCSTEVIMHFLSFYGYRVLQELISVKGKTCQRRNHRSKTVSLMLKPMIPNLDLIHKLIAAMSFTRNVISINPFGIFLSTPFPIGRRGCSLPTKRSPGLKLSCHFFC